MRIRIVSPAGSIAPEVVAQGVATLRAWGHEVTIAPHALTQYGRYAATPEQRATDIIEALTDDAVDVIWCSRGGYGCMHILDQIPQQLIAAKRKWLVGYSDVTALHALWQRCGVTSLHAPMMKHLGETPDHYTSAAIRLWLERLATQPHTARPEAINMPPHACNHCSAAEGRLIGGNLAVLSGLHSTPYDFDYHDTLLFIEDIGESPYKIDRMLQTLRLSGVFHQVRGVIVGQFSGCDEDPLMPNSLTETIRQTLGSSIPICFNAPVGHVLDNYPLVEGGQYRLLVTDNQTTLTPL